MSVSFHMDSVSIGQMGGGLIQHITRDKDNADKVIVDNKSLSHIRTDETDYNVRFDDEAEGMKKLKQAKKLVTQREKDRYASTGLTWTTDDAKKLKELQHDNDKKRKRFRASEKKSKTSKTTLLRKNAWEKVNDEMEAMKKRRDEYQHMGDSSEPQWTKSVGVAFTQTHQLSYESLEAMGWQHNPDKVDKDGIIRVKGTLFTYKQQLKYEQDNHIKQDSKDSGIHNATKAYTAIREGVISHPEIYGALIASAIHFDEDAPHLDLMTLNIGQNLDGSAIKGHVGEKDNGTKGDLLNIRARTFKNGNNAKNKNSKWLEHLQDKNGEIMHEAIDRVSGEADTWEIHRGIPKSSRGRDATNKARNARNTGQSIDSLVSSASSLVGSAHADNAMTTIITAQSIASAQSTAKSLKSMSESVSDSLSNAKSYADSSIASASNSVITASNSVIAESQANDSITDDLMAIDGGLSANSAELDSKQSSLSTWSDSLSNVSMSLSSSEATIDGYALAVSSEAVHNSKVAHNLKIKNTRIESKSADVESRSSGLQSSAQSFADHYIASMMADSKASLESQFNVRNESLNAREDSLMARESAVNTKELTAVDQLSKATIKLSQANSNAQSVASQSIANSQAHANVENMAAEMMNYLDIGASSPDEQNVGKPYWLDVLRGKESVLDENHNEVTGFKALKPLAKSFIHRINKQLDDVPAPMRPQVKKRIKKQQKPVQNSLYQALDNKIGAFDNQPKSQPMPKNKGKQK